MTENRGGRIRQTARNSAIYAIGTMISRITGLVMLPIYTRYLEPADYGVLELLSLVIELTGVLIGLRITQAMFRYYILAETLQEQREVVSTVLITVFASGTTGTAILYFSAGPLSQVIFGNTDYVFEFELFAFTLLINALMAVGLSYLRARRNPVLFVSLSVATLVLQVAMNIVFVVVLEMHVRGVVISALLSGAITATSMSLYVVAKEGLHYSAAIAKRLIIYVSPLILASLGAFYVAYADKYFIRVFGNLTQVGLYVLAARISSVLMTVWYSFNLSWSADRYEIVKEDNAREIFSRVFRFLSAVFVLIGAALALFANDFFHIMTDPGFYPAGDIVPLLVLSVSAQIYTMYSNFGIMLNENTSQIATASWLKVIIATVGYFSLIPLIGAYGAATALLFGNLFELYWVNSRSQRLYDMQLQWGAAGAMYLVAIIIVLLGMMMPSGVITYFLCRLVLYSAMLLAIYFMPIWSDQDKSLARSLFSRILMRGRARQ